MKHYPADRIRNIVLLGHGGAGKTSLTEALLFDTKVISRLGKVEDGNTVSDHDPDEIKRKISVSVAVAPLEWRDTKINIIDTPGYADFVGEALSALRVADAAIIVMDASAGVEVGMETAWRLIEARGIPKFIFMNKLHREHADFDRALAAAREAFGKGLAPIQFPVGKEKGFKGIVDLLSEEAHTFHDNADGGFEIGPIPDDLLEAQEPYHKQILEAIAEHNEELLLRYLDGETIAVDDFRHELTNCVKDGTVVPVLCGSASGNRGMQPLLDAIVDLLPSAAETEARAMHNGAEEVLRANDTGHLAALAFKTIADPHVGRVSVFRVYSGQLKSNSQVLNATNGEHERLGQLFYVRGKDHLATDFIGAGDIGAVAKLASVTTGDTLSDNAYPLVLDGITFPSPSYSAAVHPKTKVDLDKMGPALHRLVEEDPTLQLSRDPATGEAILSGLGEPHVQIALERMSRRFAVNVDLGLPRVAYRETISGKTSSSYKHKKQTGGSGQYGHVVLELEPLSDGDFVFTESVVGGSVPKNFFPAVEKGVREGMDHGPLAGYPVVNIKVTLTDGSYHAVDSNEMSFKIAAKEAFKQGILQAKPTLLEPVLMLRVTVPDNFTGDVMGDLNTKRAHVAGMTPAAGGATTIEATVPAAEIQKYATDLRSITQGRGSFSSEFSHYQPVPAQLAEQIRAAAKSESA